jgi:hypothetical protein
MRMEKDPPDLTPGEIKEALARPDSFGYFGDDTDRMFVTWALGPVIEHRDSGLLDRSNAAVLKRELGKHPEWSDDWRITEASHWAVGHVDHLSYRVIDDSGKATPIARFIKEWFRYLRDVYPVADEDHWGQLESDASYTWIKQEAPREASRLGFIVPDDVDGDTLADRLMTWWGDHRCTALESVDDQGASPSGDDYRAAFEGCGFAHEE